MTRCIRTTKYTRGLLYFTNYHTHDYRNFRLYKKTVHESDQHTRRAFIGQGSVHIDQEHQQNKPDKGLSKKKEKSRKEDTRVKEQCSKTEHIRKNIPTLYNS